jgi:alkylation response protein AidB-like acyl-CoA dehydrogenase
VDFRDTTEDASWRADVRLFIEANLGAERLGNLSDELGMGGWEHNTPWRRKLASKGWVAPAWPVAYGGAGLNVMQQFILSEEMSWAKAPSVGGLAVALLGPTLISHGTEEQQREHLSPILRGETVWCQGFSEPGAGSDLAALQTRAVRDGDDYIINGQKIWTTGAQYADWIFVLARTDATAPKHRGISFFLMDMKSPGIEIRPLIDLGNGHHVNETFFTDVRVPARNLVGDENRGWYVATTTLDYERSGIRHSIANIQTVSEFAPLLRGRRIQARNEMAERYIEANTGRLLSWRIAWMQNQGGTPTHEASINKMFNTELKQRILNTCFKVVGLRGTLMDPTIGREGVLSRDYMDAIPATISAGSSEINRNIIAQRGLGLPR